MRPDFRVSDFLLAMGFGKKRNISVANKKQRAGENEETKMSRQRKADVAKKQSAVKRKQPDLCGCDTTFMWLLSCHVFCGSAESAKTKAAKKQTTAEMKQSEERTKIHDI